MAKPKAPQENAALALAPDVAAAFAAAAAATASGAEAPRPPTAATTPATNTRISPPTSSQVRSTWAAAPCRMPRMLIQVSTNTDPTAQTAVLCSPRGSTLVM